MAIENNHRQTLTNLKAVIKSEKEKFALIIEKRTREIYDAAIESAARELSVSPVQLINFKRTAEAQRILKDNFIAINFELFDAVEKELTLLITDKNLNGVPISNTKLKEEIKVLLDSKIPRLESQVVTETTRIANTAIEYGYGDSGLVVQKQWLSVIDGRTTNICLSLNGEVADIGSPFSNGDFRPPAHINCRSRVTSIELRNF